MMMFSSCNGKRITALILLFLTSACSWKHQELTVSRETELLEKPYPINYPSSAPKPNKKIRSLKNETVIVIGESVEKDYLVYKVRTKDGLEGYVLAGPGVRKVGAE